MMAVVAERRAHSDAEIESAIETLSDPERLQAAEQLVARAAPALQGILEQALHSAGYFGSAHRAEVVRAAGVADPDERMDAVGGLVAEESRLSMLIGVAVGYELAHVLSETERGDD
jgi:hypothetical protein